MTLPIFERLVKQYEIEYAVNPLQNTRQRNVLIPRQTLFFLLNTKFHIHFQTLSEWSGWDRSIGYHSVNKVNLGIECKDALYIDEINKWAVIFKSMSGYIYIKPSATKEDKTITAEASILNLIKEYDEETQSEILYNVLKAIKND